MKKTWTIALVVLAIISLVVAVIYLTNSAGNIPSFFPGYLKNSPHKHIKHAVAFITLAVIFAIGAWMASGNKENKDKDIK